MLDTFPTIRGMMDVHSYAQLLLYPWGDDEIQAVDPGMNFQNPAYDGLRGIVGDSVYREYMPVNDQSWFVNTGNGVRDAIAAVNRQPIPRRTGRFPLPDAGPAKSLSLQPPHRGRHRAPGLCVHAGERYRVSARVPSGREPDERGHVRAGAVLSAHAVHRRRSR